ncbi:hypothetical protein N7451_011096 [Penicillium sp. IBT 35674x]|nr:hypothetical protein N7451_011096 [Penicillium sp. IBT 35674x]
MPSSTSTELALEHLLNGQNPASESAFERVKTSIENQPAHLRYTFQLEVMEYLVKLRDENEEAISLWYSYVLESGDWKMQRDESVFEIEWQKARRIHDKHRQNLEYVSTIRRKAILRWGEKDASIFFDKIHTKSMAEQVSKMLNQDLDFAQVQLGVNRELVKRLDAAGRGHRRTKSMIQGDLVRAATSLSTEPLRSQDFKRHGLQVGPDGFLMARLGPPSPDIHTEDEAESRHDPGEGAPSEASYRDGERDSPHASGHPERIYRPTTPIIFSRYGSPRRKQKQRRYKRHFGINNVPPSTTRRLPKPNPIGKNKCNCGLSRSMLASFEEIPEDVDDRARLILLRKINRKIGAISAENLCYRHTRQLCAYLGLYTRQFRYPDLISRLAYATRQIGDWSRFVKAKSAWFTPQNLPGTMVRSSFRFDLQEPHPTPRIANFQDHGFSLEDICTRIYGVHDETYRELAANFEADGNVILPRLFGWLEDDISKIDGVQLLSEELGFPVKSILQLIQVEFDLYDYHYTPAISRPRMGWNRSMFQSVTQQLIRQDVCYYAVYVGVRPDHAWRLISFPYYTKSAYPTEDTSFIHIDLNIEDFLQTGRGGNAVQGSVSFTDEDEENCSVVLPRIHHHLQGWWDKLDTDQRKQISGHTIAIHPWMWNKEYAREFGTDFERTICLTGDVRLTLPTIPHGSTGPATTLRRTVMPWFGTIEDDHIRLETAEAGVWSDIADSHRDMRLAPRIPSGSTCHVFAVNPYTFPGTAQLTGLGALSDALLGRIKWTEWSVFVELEILFGEDQAAAHRWIQEWRKRASRQFIRAFHAIISAEKAAYGERSFFYLKGAGLPIPEVHLQYQKDVGSDIESRELTDLDDQLMAELEEEMED